MINTVYFNSITKTGFCSSVRQVVVNIDFKLEIIDKFKLKLKVNVKVKFFIYSRFQRKFAHEQRKFYFQINQTSQRERF